MSDKRRAVVFGGAGFIGSHLMASLLARGYGEVISADIADPARPVDGVRYLYCDVRESISLSLGEGRVDEVYNLAAVHRTPGHADHEYFETNVPGAGNICTFCREAGITSLVFTSSIAVYGPSETAKDEKSALVPVSAYGKSKLEAENIHRQWVEENPERRLVIVRPALVFGAGEGGNFTRLAKALRTRFFVYPGRRDTIKGCGYVGDLVSSFAFAMGQGKSLFLYNYCYPKPYTTQDICEAFNGAGDLPLPLFTVPLPIMLAAGWCFEVVGLCGVKTGINRQRVMKLVQSTHIVPDTLIREGFEFSTDIEKGIKFWLGSHPQGTLQ